MGAPRVRRQPVPEPQQFELVPGRRSPLHGCVLLNRRQFRSCQSLDDGRYCHDRADCIVNQLLARLCNARSVALKQALPRAISLAETDSADSLRCLFPGLEETRLHDWATYCEAVRSIPTDSRLCSSAVSGVAPNGCPPISDKIDSAANLPISKAG